VQAPGAPDEDTTGGFEHGGWHLQYLDDASRDWVVENLTSAGGFLLGQMSRVRSLGSRGGSIGNGERM
jgi:hypothetical protein